MEKLKSNMTSHSNSHEIPFGAVKLCQNMATLINNRQGSDVQFKVGDGISTQGAATVTLYAHSLILRCRSTYFAAMLDEEKNWKENSNGVIHKPNISPTTFQDVLSYIYTGNVHAKSSENIIELIAAADEMDLEELSTECQAEFIRTIKNIFSDDNKESTKQRLSVDVAVRTHIIPALNLAGSHSLSNLSKELLSIILPHMSTIIKSPDIYTSFVNEISSEVLVDIIASDDLAMTEHSVWNLVLDWACHQTKLSKTVVEAHLNNPNDGGEDGERSSDGTLVNNTQFNQLKKVLTPLLPFVRFNLLDSKSYADIINMLIYFLPRHRYLEVTRFFVHPEDVGLLDAPRKIESSKLSKIITESTMWRLLKKYIFEAGGISGCHTLNDLKFELLYRASEHGFPPPIFHQRCDNKGPTLTIIRSVDGYLFGGVNFNSWKSDDSQSSSILNFLFALPDGRYRKKDSAIFRIEQTKSQYSTGNYSDRGSYFGKVGDADLVIGESANTTKKSYSHLPTSYEGDGASRTALAGAKNFTVSDYEVFAISKW